MKEIKLVATLTEPPDADEAGFVDALDEVAVLEVRADLVGDLDPDWLRDRFGGELLYTLRSTAEGGAASGGREARNKRIIEQSERYDLVDLEAARDCRTELLSVVPPAKRIISSHGPATHVEGLKRRFANLEAHEARYYKLVANATQAKDSVRALALAASLAKRPKRDNAVIFAGGPIGIWTRMVAPHFGSPLVYGALGKVPGAPGQPTVAQLRRDYDLPRLHSVARLFGIAGRPVMHSLSPRLHNGAYRRFGVPALYVPFHVESFGDFWIDVVESGSLDILDMPLEGLSVTAPYKEVALAVSGVSSPRAQHIGAANTLVRRDRVWQAETTDVDGVTAAIAEAGVDMTMDSKTGRRAAVVGTGGAGRAAAYSLELAGMAVTLVNRTVTHGEEASQALGLPFLPLADFDAARYEVIVHATSLGQPEDPLPFALDGLGRDHTVVDLVYGRHETPLIRAAREAGARTVDGRSVLLHQALGQFEGMTGQRLDGDTARALLDDGPEASR